MMDQCWASVEDDEPALSQHWVNALCLLGGVYYRVGRREGAGAMDKAVCLESW